MRKVVVKKSTTHGKGLFANRDFDKGERVIQYVGEKLSLKEGNRRSLYYGTIGYCPLLYTGDYYIDGICGGNESLYTNHSNRPNLEAQYDENQVWFVTKKPIRKGQELFLNYGYQP